jgi:hypothetical protein
MKQKIYFLGLGAAILMSTGAIFKVNHWPAAAIMMIIGTLVLIFLFLPAALINHYRIEKNRQDKILYIVTWVTGFVVFGAMLFKIMHWPYAGYALLIALPFPYVVFLPAFLAVTSKYKNFNIYNTVYVLLLLALNSVFAALLSLNVSKQIIIDSYNISRNYCMTEAAFSDLRVNVNQSPVNAKIDEILKITNNYQELILKNEGLTRAQWKKVPGNLIRPDNQNTAASILSGNGEMPSGIKLEKAISELISLMEKTKGYEETAKALPSILGMGAGIDNDPVSYFVFRNIVIPLSWVLIYLDSVETNLTMIKASTFSGQ